MVCKFLQIILNTHYLHELNRYKRKFYHVTLYVYLQQRRRP